MANCKDSFMGNWNRNNFIANILFLVERWFSDAAFMSPKNLGPLMIEKERASF